MGTVRIDCDVCGEMLVTKEQISVIRCEQVEGDAYRFECSDCNSVHVRPMETFHANVLIDAGFPLHLWSLPASEEIDGSLPAITNEDITAFSRDIASDEKLAELLSDRLS